jgi:hypothetical protein
VREITLLATDGLCGTPSAAPPIVLTGRRIGADGISVGAE